MPFVDPFADEQLPQAPAPVQDGGPQGDSPPALESGAGAVNSDRLSEDVPQAGAPEGAAEQLENEGTGTEATGTDTDGPKRKKKKRSKR